jgi:hypothetical protein
MDSGEGKNPPIRANKNRLVKIGVDECHAVVLADQL